MTAQAARALALRIGCHILVETLEGGLQRQTVWWPNGSVVRHDERWPRLPVVPKEPR